MKQPKMIPKSYKHRTKFAKSRVKELNKNAKNPTTETKRHSTEIIETDKIGSMIYVNNAVGTSIKTHNNARL